MEWIQKLRTKLRNIKKSPHEIAKAFAIGVFIGMLPGTGLLVALLLAVFLKLNKTIVALGALLNNPWTTAFIYAGSYKIGQWVLVTKTDVVWKELFSWHGFTFKKMGTVITPFLIGGFILALISALIAYAAVYGLMVYYQKRKRRKQSSVEILP